MDLKPTEKLALLCLAENANSNDRLAFPGHPALMTWTGLKKSYLSDVLKVLVELRLIEQTERGRRGTAATYRVFPRGCCRLHGLVDDDYDLPDVDDLEASATPDPLTPGLVPVTPDPDPSCGQSGTPDPLSEKGSGAGRERVRSHAQPKGPVSPDPHQELPPTTASPGSRLPALPHQRPVITRPLDLTGDCEHNSARYLCPICRARPARVAS